MRSKFVKYKLKYLIIFKYGLYKILYFNTLGIQVYYFTKILPKIL